MSVTSNFRPFTWSELLGSRNTVLSAFRAKWQLFVHALSECVLQIKTEAKVRVAVGSKRPPSAESVTTARGPGRSLKRVKKAPGPARGGASNPAGSGADATVTDDLDCSDGESAGWTQDCA